jgi:hypothetical protein
VQVITEKVFGIIICFSQSLMHVIIIGEEFVISYA